MDSFRRDARFQWVLVVDSPHLEGVMEDNSDAAADSSQRDDIRTHRHLARHSYSPQGQRW
jgi:hypothetical protein